MPPGEKAIQLISAAYPEFRPKTVILIEEIACALGLAGGRAAVSRKDILSFVIGRPIRLCKRFTYADWETLHSDEELKILHLLSNIVLMQRFVNIALQTGVRFVMIEIF